jgi:hypothetical protein
LASIGNTIEARDEDGGWDGGRHFFFLWCPPWPCWCMDGGEGELNKLLVPPTTIPGITIGVWSAWLVIWGDPTGGTNMSSGFKPAAIKTKQMCMKSGCLSVSLTVNIMDFLSEAFLY